MNKALNELQALLAETNDIDQQIKYTFKIVKILQKIEDSELEDSELTVNGVFYNLLSTLYCNNLNKKITNISSEIILNLNLKYKEYNYDNNELYDLIICAYLNLKDYENSYKLYTEYSNFIGYPLRSHYYELEEIFDAYEKLVIFESEINAGSTNIDTYIEIIQIYDNYLGNKDKSTYYLEKALTLEPENAKINIMKLQKIEYDEEFEVVQPQYINLLQVTNNNPDVVRAFLNFTYPARSYNEENTRYCATLAHALLDKNEEIDYPKLISLYEALGDEKNEFELLQYADTKMEDGKQKTSIYCGLGYFYEKDDDLKNAVKYYKLYRKHQRVWCGDSKEELDNDIKEMEEKLLSITK